jgi:hypothetical protein
MTALFVVTGFVVISGFATGVAGFDAWATGLVA